MKALSLLAIFAIVAFAMPLQAQKVKADLDKSSLTWTGKKVTGQHHGSISIESGWMKIDGNKITEGEYVIDMKSLTVEDLTGEMKGKLEGHLKSDDFFGVEKHGKSVLKITGSEAINSSGFKVMGNLTIKGITNPIEFETKKMGNKYVSSIVVDRSKFDVRYGSGSFFDNLGDKTIYDDFTIDVVLETK